MSKTTSRPRPARGDHDDRPRREPTLPRRTVVGVRSVFPLPRRRPGLRVATLEVAG